MPPDEQSGQPHGPAQSGAVSAERASSGGSHADEPTRVSGSRQTSSGTPGTGERPTIEGYELLEELHRGGQGVVYRAIQLGTKQTVALKVLLEGPFASEQARMRFEREVELAASLRHPSIVTILDSGISRGRYYFAMEYIAGKRLDRYLRDAQPGLRQTLILFQRIAEAVNFAHQRGVIHRDLKPSNILVTPDGVPHVLDFGLAKSARDVDPRQTTVRVLSTTGQVIGTLAYMSPEQARGAQDVDIRSDVYALGVIFYEGLLGRAPYEVSGPLGDVLNRISKQEPLRPRAARSTSRFGRMINDELETILLKALDKDPERRYQSAGGLARDLGHYLNNEPIEAKRASGLYLLRKLLRRYRLQAYAALAVLTTLIVCLAVVVVLYRQEYASRQRAEQLRLQADREALRAQQAYAAAAEAEARERRARRRAEENERRAQQVNEQLRASLIRQMVHRGDMAMVSRDYANARDSYWQAYLEGADQPAALWALRRYYLDSGDNGATQLAASDRHALALSPNGLIAAASDGDIGLLVRNTVTGETLYWVAVPGRADVLSVDNDGRCAAAGRQWAAWWSPDTARPVAAVTLPANARPRATLLDPDARHLIIATSAGLRLSDASSGQLLDELRSRSPLRDARISPDGRLLTLATADGLRGVAIGEDGKLSGTTLWPAGQTDGAYAACFADPDTLYLLADAVYRGTRGADGFDWQRALRLRESFANLDIAPDGATLALADDAGHTVIARDQRQTRFWRAAASRLPALRFDPTGQSLLTLDPHAVLTHWLPPERIDRGRRIFDGTIYHWTHSEDGNVLAWVDREGNINTYDARTGRRNDVTLPGLLRSLTGRDPENILLALDEPGRNLLIQSGTRLWLHRVGRARPVPLRWRAPGRLGGRGLALSWDGSLAAIAAASEEQDRQVVAFRVVDGAGYRGRTPPWGVIDFTGATIQQIGYVPHSYTLLVARSNGALFLLDPPVDPRVGLLHDAKPWITLESPAYCFAYSRDADWLALACEDGKIRLLDASDGSPRGQILVSGHVSTLGFSPNNTVLLVRLEDGSLDLYDLDLLQPVSRWEAPVGDAPALATWVGRQDAIARTDAEGLTLVDFASADQRIRENEIFGLQREVTRHIANGDFQAAWTAAEQLHFRDRAAGIAAQRDLLTLVLSGRQIDLPPKWIDTVLAEADAQTLRRLGHAAFAGGRFELAQRLLLTGSPPDDQSADTTTALRLAECTYLLGPPADAALALGRLLDKLDLPPDQLARLRLEYLAALVLSDQVDEARRVFAEYKAATNAAPNRGSMAMAATLLIGNYLLGNQAQTQLNTTYRTFLSVFKTQWLDYRDDIAFFAGELARHRGDLHTAEAQYQLCIDIARDAWPEDLARLRIRQLFQSVAESEPAP